VTVERNSAFLAILLGISSAISAPRARCGLIGWLTCA